MAVLGGLREDLSVWAPQPLPPATLPRALRWLPHVLVVLAAFILAAAAEASSPLPLAVGHALTLVVGLRLPLPAWWLSMAFLIGTAATTYSPIHTGEVWPWVVHAGVLFLVALRNRPRVAVETLLLSLLPAGGLWLLRGEDATGQDLMLPTALFAVAVFLGATWHGRRETRGRLAEQEAVTARERARRTLLEERARIARELHDVVAHHMSVISIQADAAPHRVKNPPEELVNSFAVIRENALEALAELRHVLGVLRSEDPGEIGAPATPQPGLDQLDGVVANVRAAGLRVRADVTGTPRPLPPGVQLSAFRIVQEALSNALRHAPGSEALVEIAYAAAELRVRVRNGHANERPAPSPGAGHGVLGMRERAAMLGGELAAGPTPDGGYEVIALLPVPAGTATTVREGRP